MTENKDKKEFLLGFVSQKYETGFHTIISIAIFLTISVILYSSGMTGISMLFGSIAIFVFPITHIKSILDNKKN